MTDELCFYNREGLQNWLNSQTIEVSVALAARAALRFAPFAICDIDPESNEQERQYLTKSTGGIFRAAALGRFVALHFDQADEFRVIAKAMSSLFIESATSAHAVALTAAATDVTNAASAASCLVDCEAARFPPHIANAAFADTLAAEYAAMPAAEKYAKACAASYPAAATGLDGANEYRRARASASAASLAARTSAVAAIWTGASADANFIAGGGSVPPLERYSNSSSSGRRPHL